MAKIRRSIELEESVWRMAKSEAALAGKTLSTYIEGLIPAQEIDPWLGQERFEEIVRQRGGFRPISEIRLGEGYTAAEYEAIDQLKKAQEREQERKAVPRRVAIVGGEYVIVPEGEPWPKEDEFVEGDSGE